MDGGHGPLAPFADGFRQELLGLDHPPESVKHYLVLMGQLDGWLMVEGREVVELTAAVAEEFLVTRRARGQRRVPTLASLVPLFECNQSDPRLTCGVSVLASAV